MKKRPLRQKQGFAIILAVFLMLAFSVLGYTALNILVNKNDINVKTLASLQAFYLARAARNFALEYYINYGSDFTDTAWFPTGVTRNFNTGTGGTGKSFAITRTNTQAKTADITFSGTVTGPGLNITRRIRQTFNGTTNLPTSLNYAFVSLSGEVVFATYSPPTNPPGALNPTGNLTIIGNCYFIGEALFGNVDWVNEKWCVIFGPTIGSSTNPAQIYVNSNVFVGMTTIYGDVWRRWGLTTDCDRWGIMTLHPSTDPLPVPVPAKPAIDTTYYNNERSIANSITSTNAAAGRWLGNQNFSTGLTLTGMNYYIKGNLTISGTVGGSGANVGVPANIVATGNITISSGATIGPRITLISGGTITVNSGTTIGGNWNVNSCTGGAGVLLFADNWNPVEQDIGISANGTSASWVRIKGAILSPSPTPQTQIFRSINFTEFNSLAGVIYAKSIGGTPVGSPVRYNFGTVSGSVVVNGPLNDGVYFEQFSNLNKAKITYTQNMIPLSIKGLYNISGSTWSYPLQ